MYVTLATMEEAIRSAWCRETTDDPDEWSLENPSRGQCGVTALVVRDYLGGELLMADVLPADGGKVIERHCWNRLGSGVEIDLTREQFRNGETLGEPFLQEPFVATGGVDRYVVLADLVRERLTQRQS